MRALFIALAIGCVFFAAAAYRWDVSGPRSGDFVGLAALCFAVFGGAVIHASIIAGERRSRTIQLILEKPIRLRNIFLSKLVTAL